MPVTTFYAGLLALWFLVLSYRVVQQRGHGVRLGDGGDPVLLRRIRAHGNFAEYVPFILIMIGLLESGGFPPWCLHTLGATLLIARLLHGISLSFTESWKFGRFYGTLLTFILLALAGLLSLWCALHMLGKTSAG